MHFVDNAIKACLVHVTTSDEDVGFVEALHATIVCHVFTTLRVGEEGISHLFTIEVHALCTTILGNNNVSPYARNNLITLRHHVFFGAIVFSPSHGIERNLVGLMVFPLRTDSNPEVAPVVMRPAILNGILVNEVSSLLVVSETVGLKPKCIRVISTYLQIGGHAEHIGIGNNQTSRNLSIAISSCVAVLHFFAHLHLLLASRYGFDVRHGASAYR